MMCAGSEEGERDHEPRNAESEALLDAGKGKETDSLLEWPEGTRP